MPKQIKAYFLSVILLIVGLSLGFLAGKNTSQPLEPVETETGSVNALYSSQTAFIRGKISTINGKNLVVTNLTTKASGDVLVSDRVIITKPNKNASPSSDLATLEKDKEVLINLEMIDKEYQAVTIQYINPVPKPPSISGTNPTKLP